MGASAQLCKLYKQIQGTGTIETRLASPEQGGKEDLPTVLQNARNLTEDRRTGRKKPYGKREHQPGRWSRPEEKDLCYGIRYQEKGVRQAHKAGPTNPSGLTGLVVWDGSVKVGGWVECGYWGSE